MILPTKHIPLRSSLLGVGALLLQHLDREHTVTSLWSEIRTSPDVATFQRFVLGLDFLYALGVIRFHEGTLQRTRP